MSQKLKQKVKGWLEYFIAVKAFKEKLQLF